MGQRTDTSTPRNEAWKLENGAAMIASATMSRNGSRAVAATTSRHEPTTVIPHFRDDAWSNARYDVTPAALSTASVPAMAAARIRGDGRRPRSRAQA